MSPWSLKLPSNRKKVRGWYKQFTLIPDSFKKLQQDVEYFSSQILICQRHLSDVYHPDRTNTSRWKLFLSDRLVEVFDRFGIKHSQTKFGPLDECMHIVLNGLGHSIMDAITTK
jgi:hypothetical protein